MNHEVEVSNLMFNKTSSEQIEFKKYDINVDLEEDSSIDGKTVLKYSLDLTSNPKNSVINISGNTILIGEQEEIENFLKQENEKTPEVVSLIYQELFPLMYIITKNMKIPSPSHTIAQNSAIESVMNDGQTMNNKQTVSEDKIDHDTKKIESESLEELEEPKSADIESNNANTNETNES